MITRLDVSSFFSQDDPDADLYLHGKQENNKALMAQLGMVDDNKAFVDGMGNKTGAYRLRDLLDASGISINTTPFLDIILYATGSLAAGADVGKANTANGDVPLHLYVDNVFDYNPGLKYDATSTDPNHAANCLAKFFDATKIAANAVSNYLVKGSDLALETMVENSGGENKDTGTTYWSLKKSIEHPYYDLPEDASPDDPGCGRTVKLMSEVPIVGNLSVEGTSDTDLKKRTLDANSYDVQVANNTSEGKDVYTAGVLLKNGWLTIKDGSNTTGAEVAIGNNARFTIDVGGKLIIDETCQLEIEFDAATTTPNADGTMPTPDTLNRGLLDLRAGGEIVNNGIITIEGTEGKPIQPGATQTVTSIDRGDLTIGKGSTLTNNGSIMAYGELVNLGTIVNNGKYNDLILSNDPDKGVYAYHKGIQISWKDDITQDGILPGVFSNGMGKDLADNPQALLINNGDILLNPGHLFNFAILMNNAGANIYLANPTEAIIPINPTAEAPTVVTKRITLDRPEPSYMFNLAIGTEVSGTIVNSGNIVPASVVLNDNGSFGALSFVDMPLDTMGFGFLKNYNMGTVINNGYIYGWDDPAPTPTPETKPAPGRPAVRTASAAALASKMVAATPRTGDDPARLPSRLRCSRFRSAPWRRRAGAAPRANRHP